MFLQHRLLYAAGDLVPRVDFLTTIDRMIFITLGMLLWLGVESAAVYYGEERYGFSLTQVRTVGPIVGLSTLVGYGPCCLYNRPARWRQSEARA